MSKASLITTGLLFTAGCCVPIFRSGGRTHLTFFEWVINHTIFGPPVEYVPEEDYSRELEGIEPISISALVEAEGEEKVTEKLAAVMTYYKIDAKSAAGLW